MLVLWRHYKGPSLCRSDKRHRSTLLFLPDDRRTASNPQLRRHRALGRRTPGPLHPDQPSPAVGPQRTPPRGSLTKFVSAAAQELV
ncbi:hypothetical protein D623_10003102 [Myotis brandtii]|uniref:Uncharacterized protein n=1 Tax=Myotis brandtii TaxID=109478 RepID=S7MQU2_MYOBR|nr:hypothetical protein D623_10003102 [Myotis brandtii]